MRVLRVYQKPIVGQPVITPDGFGKVVRYRRDKVSCIIRVRNDMDGIDREWAAENVRFVRFETDPFYHEKRPSETMPVFGDHQDDG